MLPLHRRKQAQNGDAENPDEKRDNKSPQKASVCFSISLPKQPSPLVTALVLYVLTVPPTSSEQRLPSTALWAQEEQLTQ
ncbi:hypothetical protein E5288_WYG005485 [Bos mutus]|uniref:Uncharacterized protein n=1 Tax=Bos mutus TaxID=72004 RepID=A0A6B0RQW9_9CETA|nr:hypothetical protein [Bos mutus]